MRPPGSNRAANPGLSWAGGLGALKPREAVTQTTHATPRGAPSSRPLDAPTHRTLRGAPRRTLDYS